MPVIMLFDSDYISTQALTSAFSVLEKGTDHVFITGKAGTGKSTLLMKYREKLRSLGHELVVLAPTGVAALHIEGQTIHSFFGLAPNASVEETIATARRHRKKELFRTLTEIVIDEISMVRSDLLDCIDIFLQTIRQSPLPFGGVRMIFFGDLYQLPPVVTSYERESFMQLYESPYFFNAKVMDRVLHEELFGGLQLIELDHIFRQQDTSFIQILNAIRNQSVTFDHLELLNTRVGADINFDTAIVLTSRRNSAQRLNQKHLDSLGSSYEEYSATVTGNFPSSYQPTPEILQLKKGARVMFVANDTQKRWVNGTLGTVLEVLPSTVLVRLDSGEQEVVTPHTWDVSRMVLGTDSQQLEREVLGSYKQLPLTVAHAITVHKAQGKTFQDSVVDLRDGMFAFGQAYVALSRVQSLQGLSLTAPFHTKHIHVDASVKHFLSNF